MTYEDITALMRPILRHRVLLNFQAESDRLTHGRHLEQNAGGHARRRRSNARDIESVQQR